MNPKPESSSSSSSSLLKRFAGFFCYAGTGGGGRPGAFPFGLTLNMLPSSSSSSSLLSHILGAALGGAVGGGGRLGFDMGGGGSEDPGFPPIDGRGGLVGAFLAGTNSSSSSSSSRNPATFEGLDELFG